MTRLQNKLLALLLVIAVMMCCSCSKKTPVKKQNTSSKVTSSEIKKVENPIPFDELQAFNPDIYAYIVIPDVTSVSNTTKFASYGGYPVLQSSTTDEASKSYGNTDYYLDHNEDYTSGFPGCIYSQNLNSTDFNDPVTVLYGHDMRNDSMFGALHYFHEKEGFFDSHDTMYIYTKGHILTYMIFAAYKYDNRHILNSFNFYDLQVREDYFNSCLNPQSTLRSVRAGATLGVDSKIVTLSTCINNDNYRYLVQGVLIDDQLTY